jgi:hypothetical protein
VKLIPNPKFSVTWPTRPGGVYTQIVRAVDATDAVRIAAQLAWPTSNGYSVAWDYTPEVWQVSRPYTLRSRRVAGPAYDDEQGAGFIPLPV